MQENAKLMILTGSLVLLLGIVFYFFGEKLSWIGRLPGDFRYERDNFSFYFPLTTLLLLSLLINILLRLFRKFF
ncbi:MAG: DUF2905 domain-containing protein [Sphingobacteriales bacterium]|nr:DUF2905 domain-containing protein [Sphingobacteriales bacterium]